MAFYYTKHYWRPLLMLSAAAGVFIALYAIYASQRATIAAMTESVEKTGKELGKVQQANALLISSNATLKSDRERAEKSYLALNDKNRANALKLEETVRENARLRKNIAGLQKDDPGANAPVPAGVMRLHAEAVRQFNDKYGEKAAGTAAGGNVPATR